MTEELRALLQQFGSLSAAIARLRCERPGSEYETLEEYYSALGLPLADEPTLVVKISEDGQARVLKEGHHDIEFRNQTGTKVGQVTVWELPEDEFWYFKAFRPEIFKLDIDLPAFMYEMSIAYAYSVFEGYISDLLRLLLRKHPQLMGSKREITYEQIFEAKSRDDLIEAMIEREMRDLTYLPLLGLITKMREKFGFRKLTSEYDVRANRVSLIRNCLLHNRGIVDAKLARADASFKESEKLCITIADVDHATLVLRKAAYAIDKCFENIM